MTRAAIVPFPPAAGNRAMSEPKARATAPPRPLRGLYLITPDDTDTTRLVERTSAVIGHASLLQYRNKQATPPLAAEQLAALRPLCRAHGVPLLVNDDWRLARDAGRPEGPR